MTWVSDSRSSDEFIMGNLVNSFMTLYEAWARQQRSPDDQPLSLEQIATHDGRGIVSYEIPTTEAQEANLTNRCLQVISALKELSPAPSVAFIAHGRAAFLFTALDSGDAPRVEMFSSPIPPLGEDPDPLERVDISDQILVQRTDGPYGEEAVQVAAHALGDLFQKLQAWAGDERSGRDLPLEQVMYDGGEVWRHMDVPPTEISRPSLAARIKELIPVLVEVAPSPAVASFNHRKKHYLLSSFNTVPGELIIRILRFEIPPPGSLFEDPEELDPSKLGIA